MTISRQSVQKHVRDSVVQHEESAYGGSSCLCAR